MGHTDSGMLMNRVAVVASIDELMLRRLNRWRLPLRDAIALLHGLSAPSETA